MKTSILGSNQLILLFIIKVFCGILYGYIFSKHMEDADTWRIFNYSVSETKLLISNPKSFFASWLYDSNVDYKNIFSSENSYWNNLRDIMMIKTEAFLNIVSFSNYYINVLFYAFLTFFGYIAFVKAYNSLFPNTNKALLIIAAFLIPSTFFWTSGMHKDGIIFMLISFIVYQLSRYYNAETSRTKAFFKIFICLLFIFSLRNYIALLLIPAIAISVCAYKFPKHAYRILFGTIAAGIVVFFLSPYISPSFNLPEWLIKRRIDFYALEANTKMPINALEATFYSYLQNLPQAFNHGFLRPYLWENIGIRYIPFALEIVLLVILIFYALYKKIIFTSPQRAIFLFGIFLFFTIWLFLGYMVHIIGALVRYKSIFIPFLVASLLLSIKSNKYIKK